MRHGSRRSSVPAIAAVVALVLVVGGVVGWLVLRDHDKDTGSGSPTAQLPEQTFALDGVPFTFTYPGNFAQAQPPAGFRWVAGVSPVDILDVKEIAAAPLQGKRLERQVGRALRRDTSLTIVGASSTSVAGVPAYSVTLDNNASGSTLSSQLYYFVAGGATWQLECQSQPSGQATIHAACSQMLGSIALS